MTNTRLVIWLALFGGVGLAIWLAWLPWSGPDASAPPPTRPPASLSAPSGSGIEQETVAPPQTREAVPLSAAHPRPAPSAAAPPRRLHGRLLHASGARVPDARILLGGNEVRTDARGEFAFALTAGRSATIRVSDAAVWLVLLSDGAELRRVPLALARTDTQLVRG